MATGAVEGQGVSKFSCILADPCWAYSDPSLNRGGALRHYQTMTVEDMAKLRVGDLAAEDCALFMWVTWPMIYESKLLFDAWGFTPKTCAFVWIKTHKLSEVNQTMFLPEHAFDHSDGTFWGMGRWTRSCTEFCLLGTRGKPKRISGAVHQVIYAPVSRHSAKPPETRDRIVQLLGDVPRVELFAREATPEVLHTALELLIEKHRPELASCSIYYMGYDMGMDCWEIGVEHPALPEHEIYCMAPREKLVRA